MNLSYWETKSWLGNIDFTIIGSGITGLNCALALREKQPKAKILVLEKGMLPQGASTKNAGFACFGSLSEILDDLKSHSEETVFQLVKKRWDGLQLLRKNLGDKAIDFQQLGGYELFLESDTELYESCFSQSKNINDLLEPIFKTDVFNFKDNPFQFNNIQKNCGFNKFEGQIDTGKMMEALLKKAYQSDIKIVNNCEVESFSDDNNTVKIKTKMFEFSTSKLFIATNGFAYQLDIPQVKPARAQILITKPIPNLAIRGTFHLEQGYYYFRNIDDRILLGGGRQLDFKTEETSVLAQTELIQNSLEGLLKTVILPNTDFEIDCNWSGIMGVGEHKTPIVKQLFNNVFCGVRLGGMGVAIGSLVGKELADLA